MIHRFSNGTTTWYDLISPTSEEIRMLTTEAGIPVEHTGDLTSRTPHTDGYLGKDVIKLTLHFPFVKRTDLLIPHEVKFLATKNALITIHFEDIQAIESFQKDFEVVSMLKRAGKSLSGTQLLFTLLLRMYKGLDDKLDYLQARLQDIDAEIFNGREKEMVLEIANVGRRLISFRQSIEAHEQVLHSLASDTQKILSKAYLAEAERTEVQHRHIMRRLARILHALQELRETNNSLITTKQNETMKVLTIMAFITFPLTLVSSMFGMNTIATPIVGRANDFWIILSFMTFGFICFFMFFKYKRWM